LSVSKIIKHLKKKHPNLSQSELQNVIDIFLETLLTALKSDKSIEIRDLGRFTPKKLKENFNARNPATNELIYKPKRVKIRFNPSKKLKKIINE
jgi:nucleoid DNA-binding protein